jgi:hypothetical protein
VESFRLGHVFKFPKEGSRIYDGHPSTHWPLSTLLDLQYADLFSKTTLPRERGLFILNALGLGVCDKKI